MTPSEGPAASLRCPACRADNVERTCRRCRADLGLLWDLEASRTQLLLHAPQAWQRGDMAAVASNAAEAAWLRAGEDSTRWTALVALAKRDFPAALAAWRLVRRGH